MGKHEVLFRKEHCYTAFYPEDPTVLQRMEGPGTALLRAHLLNRLQEAAPALETGAGFGGTSSVWMW